MSLFTSESAVRLKFQITDPVLASSALIAENMEHAHAEILRSLDPATPHTPPPAEVALGETLLAGAHLLRSLASAEAGRQKEVAVGGQRIATGKRFAALITLSEQAEAAAWRTLAPYCAALRGEVLARTTTSAPILGG